MRAARVERQCDDDDDDDINDVSDVYVDYILKCVFDSTTPTTLRAQLKPKSATTTTANTDTEQQSYLCGEHCINRCALSLVD